MKLGGRIPVEQLDDERLTRIERAIVVGASDRLGAPQRRPTRALGFALAAAAAMGAGALGWRLHTSAPLPPAVAIAPIAVTTQSQKATLDIGDATIESSADTAFVVTHPDGGVLIAMTRGRVELQVAKRAGRPDLVVRAGDTDVHVVGTRFSVDYGDGHGAVDVHVIEGVVRVEREQQATLVAAGHEWKTAGGLVASAEPALVPVAPVAIDTHHDVALHDHVSAVPPPAAQVAHVVVAPHAVAVVATPPVHVVTPPPSDARGDLKADVRRQPVEGALDVGVSDPKAELTRYLQIVVGAHGEHASKALYSIAYVQYLKLGEDNQALSTLDNYLRRFEGGQEYNSALWLRVRILCTRAIDDRCRQAAYTYSARVSEGTSADVAHRLTISD